jgi:hypothetical protein
MTFAVFQQQMDRLAGLRFRPTSLQTHWEALGDLDVESLTRAISWGQRVWPEFPSPAQVRDAVEASVPVVVGRDAVRADPCPECRDTGWAELETSTGQVTVQRCACWFTNPVLLRRRERDTQQAAQRQMRVKASA